MEDKTLFCAKCGAKSDVGSILPNNLSLSDFYKCYASDRIKKSVKSVMVAGLIIAAINLVLCMVTGLFYGLIDVALIAGISLWFYNRPEKLPAYCLLGYNLLSMILGLILNGTFSGWWLLIVAIFAIKTAAEVNKEYTEYIQL